MKWPFKPLRKHFLLICFSYSISKVLIICSPTWKLQTNCVPSWSNYIYHGWIANKIRFYSCIICLVYRICEITNLMSLGEYVLIWLQKAHFIYSLSLCVCVTGIPRFVWRCLWLCWLPIMTLQDVITQNCATLKKENWARVKTSPVLISRITFSLEKNHR